MNRGKLVPFNPAESHLVKETPSNELIYQQLNKIMAHRLFSRSAILSKFLFYVVHETLTGNTNRIKEYTIAVNVLNKSKKFDVQRSGIVRVHASRLRRTLEDYYNSETVGIDVIINIPSGGYVPIFQSNRYVITGHPLMTHHNSPVALQK